MFDFSLLHKTDEAPQAVRVQLATLQPARQNCKILLFSRLYRSNWG